MKTKLLVGTLVLFFAVAISAIAAYFSVVGLSALFAAAFIPVCIMGIFLEGGKLVAAGWLHANWENKNVTKIHKGYLTAAVITLMLITSMGIYGYLTKAHLEQQAPASTIIIDVDQRQAQIDQLVAQREQLATQQKAINDTVSTYLSSGKATGASQFMKQQKTQLVEINTQINDLNNQITEANVALAPLKKQIAGSQTELGQWKYLAKALHLKDPESAIDILIKLLIFAFDPLAVILMISGTITIGEWQREKNQSSEAEPEEIEPEDDNEPVEEIEQQNDFGIENEVEENIMSDFETKPTLIWSPPPSPAGTMPEKSVFADLLSRRMNEVSEKKDISETLVEEEIPIDFDEDLKIKFDTLMEDQPKEETPSLEDDLTEEDIELKIKLAELIEREPEIIKQIVDSLENKPDNIQELIQTIEDAIDTRDKISPEKQIPWLDLK